MGSSSKMVALACLVVALPVVYWGSGWLFGTGSSGGGVDSISSEEMTWVKCNNPSCKAEYEMGLKDYHKAVEERLDPTAMMSAPPLVCEECGEPSIFRAEKCENSDCGIVFFRGAVPNDFADRCPECKISATEESRKRRKAGGQ